MPGGWWPIAPGVQDAFDRHDRAQRELVDRFAEQFRDGCPTFGFKALGLLEDFCELVVTDKDSAIAVAEALLKEMH